MNILFGSREYIQANMRDGLFVTNPRNVPSAMNTFRGNRNWLITPSYLCARKYLDEILDRGWAIGEVNVDMSYMHGKAYIHEFVDFIYKKLATGKSVVFATDFSITSVNGDPNLLFPNGVPTIETFSQYTQENKSTTIPITRVVANAEPLVLITTP